MRAVRPDIFMADRQSRLRPRLYQPFSAADYWEHYKVDIGTTTRFHPPAKFVDYWLGVREWSMEVDIVDPGDAFNMPHTLHDTVVVPTSPEPSELLHPDLSWGRGTLITLNQTYGDGDTIGVRVALGHAGLSALPVSTEMGMTWRWYVPASVSVYRVLAGWQFSNTWYPGSAQFATLLGRPVYSVSGLGDLSISIAIAGRH